MKDDLRRIFGERCIFADEEPLTSYSRDQTDDPIWHQEPSAVVFPRSTDEVAALMSWATKTGTPVTPRGGGSGLAGAAIPARGGVVCSFRDMNRILEIDRDNLMAVVEPGVVTAELDRELAETGLFFAGYPMSEDICQVGGNVAENAGGGRAVKYGVTGDYVLGADIVTPTGGILRLGGKRLKDVTGYNLLSLFIGSEGTLGLFTRIILRLVPRPAYRAVLLTGFTDSRDAVSSIVALKAGIPGSPSSLEFVDGRTAWDTNLSLPASAQISIPEDLGALVLIEVDGENFEELERRLNKAAELISNQNGRILDRGIDRTDSEGVWKLRKQVPWRVKKMTGPWHSMEDVVVPPSSVADLVEHVEVLRQRYKLPIALFGHAGDGNFHVTPMKPESLPKDQWPQLLDSVLEDLYRRVGNLGGTLSGEHGIGRKRMKSLPIFLDEEQMNLLRELKNLLDPRGVMNPGVVLPSER